MSVEILRLRSSGECPQHGRRSWVKFRGTDALGFSHFVHVCEGCLDEAIEAYRNSLLCVDCGGPVPAGTGTEQDGVLTPRCLTCQGRRLAAAGV